MNKFFAKLAGALSLVALVAGAGVAVASGVNAKGVKAAASYEFTGDTITFANQGLENSVQYTDPFTSEVFSVQFGGGGNDGKYYTTGSGMRTYGNGYFTITAATGTVSQIDFTWDGSNKPTSNVADSGSFNASYTTWTGNAESVTCTRPTGSGHWRLKVIKVTLGSEGKEYNVSGTITNGSLDKSKVAENTELNVKIVPNTGYDVPASVTSVTMGGSTAAYTYDATTGNVNIASVTGDVVINATCPSLPQPEHAGTESDPYTVEDVIRLINLDKSATHSGVYVSGIISQVDSYNSTYHSITYWISDDGTTAKQFECYSGKGIDSADFSAITDVEVGASVVVCGTAKYYGTTYEFDKNNYLVSYDVTKTLDSITLSGDYPTEFEVGDTFSYEGLVVTAHYDDSSSKVVTPTSVSTPDMTSIGEKTVTVSYTEDEVKKDAEYIIEVTAVSTKWTISFDPGEGSGEMASVQVKDGDDYTLPACTFTGPEGKVFDYWDVYGEEKEIIENVDDDYEVTAMWKDGPSEVTDTLNNGNTIKETSTTYKSWTTEAMTSGAIYAGQSAGDKTTIQLRSNNSNSGVVSSTSGGDLVSVTINFNSDTADTRTVSVYGKTSAYSNPTELYNDSTKGTLLGEANIDSGASQTITVEGSYQYVGIRSKSGALYLDSIDIVWNSSVTPPEPKVLESISVSGAKTDFKVGDDFVTTGLVVTAHYEDSSESVITDGYTVDSSAVNKDAAGTYNIVVSYEGKSDNYDVTYANPVLATYKKVESDLADFSGQYLIVYEGDGGDHPAVAFNGSITDKLDVAPNSTPVTINNGVISLSDEYEFTISAKEGGGYSIRSSSDIYIGKTADSNGLDEKKTDDYANTISYVPADGDNAGYADIVGSGGAHLRYNYASNEGRFRFFKSSTYTGQQAISLYEKVADAGEALMLDLLNTTDLVCNDTEKEHSKADFETAWSALKTAYNAISDEAVLTKLATTDGKADGTMFLEGLARYDILVRKYSLENFISDRVVSGLGSTSVISNGSVDSNSAMIIITVIALTSISSIAVLLVIKRRKAIR